MPEPIVDQVVDFHAVLFERIFTEPFRPRISERLRRNAVARQIEEAADAASQSLSRFFLNQQLTPDEVEDLLAGLQALGDLLDLERVSNSNVTPESVTEDLLAALPLPEAVQQAGNEAVCRVALHSVVQVLMLVGPVMAEWQKLSFSSTFELPRRVVNRLNQISEQLDLLGRGESLADERYELTYRDYLLQRFHRVEAGTVRMTTNLAVDLRELFVMPRVRERPSTVGPESAGSAAVPELMSLAAARKIFQNVPGSSQPESSDQTRDLSALDQVQRTERLVLIGAPGSGKSTFLEWLQLKLASVEEELILAGQQAIPLLLRVRQLDPSDLPQGAALIERATASRDRASLMPAGWIERQLQKGRAFLLLDGLDETEPELRDRYLIPWLRDLCARYPACRYLVSSRPVGYSPGALHDGTHGTHVCGTIAGGKTAEGIAIGVAPEANLLVAGVLIGDATLQTLMEGISWAVEKGADIINMSLGFTYYEPLFAEVFQMLLDQYGVLPVVAIGNENHGNCSSPGNAWSAFSVGAAEKMPYGKLGIAPFSSGASLVFPGVEPNALVTKPDVVAPGVQIYSAIPPEKKPSGIYEYSYMDGTSMATPHVSGVAALLMAAYPEAPVTDIMQALKETAHHPDGEDRRPDNRWGYGMIQPVEAFKALAS